MTLTAIIDKQVIAKKKDDYKKYQELYQVTHDFIKKNNFLLYGGLAINNALHMSKRFYEEYELPDYDFFCVNSFKVAKQLADIYLSKKYKYIEVKPGLHSGTYKVFVEFMPVADITDIPSKLYEKMLELSIAESSLIRKNNPSIDLNIVPLDFLKMSTHLELSRPDGFIERWEKVFYRMQLLYSTYPILIEECSIFEQNPYIEDITNKIKNIMKTRDVLYTGVEVIKHYLKTKGYINDMTNIDFISKNYLEDTEYIKATLKIDNLKISHHSALNKSQLIPKHYIIKTTDKAGKTINLCTIFDSVSCYSYKNVTKMKYASIDTLLSFLYAYLLTSRSYINNDKIKCIISHLQTNKSNFELNCYGVQEKPTNIKKERWDKGKKPLIYRPK